MSLSWGVTGTLWIFQMLFAEDFLSLWRAGGHFISSGVRVAGDPQGTERRFPGELVPVGARGGRCEPAGAAGTAQGPCC